MARFQANRKAWKTAALLGAAAFLTPAPSRGAKSRPYAWRNVVIVGGGFVTGVIPHPSRRDLVYARTDVGGAYRWGAGQKRWLPLTDGFGAPDANLVGIESLAVDPHDSRRVYLAAGTYTQSWAGYGAILRSSDRGRTWSRVDLPIKMGGNEAGRFNGERLAVDPNRGERLFFGSRHNGLWKSEDRGATWNRASSFPVPADTQGVGIVFIVFDPKSGSPGRPSSRIYAGVSSPEVGLFRSIDGGITWAVVPGQPVGLRPNHAALSPDGSLYLTYGKEPGPNVMTDGAVWKFDPKTGAWSDVTPVRPTASQRFGYGGLAVDAAHPGAVMVTTFCRWNPGDEIFRSIDGGARWTPLGPQAVRSASDAPWLNWHRDRPSATGWMGDIEIDPFRPNRAWYVTGQGIWESEDVTNADRGRPTHWRFRSQGLEETVPLDLVSPPSGAHLLSGVGDLGGFRHDDLNASPPDGMFDHPIFGNGDSLDFAEKAPSVVARVGRADRGAPQGALSLDGGTTWTPFPPEPEGGRGSGSIAVAADGRAFVWTPRGGPAFVSRDRGATWTPCAGLPPRLKVVSDRVNPNRFYAFDPGGVFYASADGGATFAARSSDLPRNGGDLRAAPGFEGSLWLVAGDRLYRSRDGGAHFNPVETAQVARKVGLGKAAPGRGYPALYLAGTVDGVYGFYRSDDEGATWTRINDDRHQFGWINAIIGDPRIYGRVYVATGGRGILYGDPTKPGSP